MAKARAQVFVCARRESAAARFARAVEGETPKRSALRKLKFDVILNATPVGMHPQVGISPLARRRVKLFSGVGPDLPSDADEVVRIAAEKGCKTVSGVEMFIAQGIAQWEHVDGQSAPEAADEESDVNGVKKEEKDRITSDATEPQRSARSSIQIESLHD